jgi:chromosome segregation ATPase
MQSENEHSFDPGMSTRDFQRMRKGSEQNVRTVQHRINYFQREEERIWRGLEDVRRQAAKIEECRSRLREREAAENCVKQLKYRGLMEHRIRAKTQREELIRRRKQNTLETLQSKRFSSHQQKSESRDLERWKHIQQAQHHRTASERVISMQREMIDANLKTNQERSERLSRIREEQERARLEAQRDVDRVEGKLPLLEEKEMACLQRLQNSRIVERTVLQELEASLGAPLAITNMLKSRQSRSLLYRLEQSQDLNQITDVVGCEDELAATM